MAAVIEEAAPPEADIPVATDVTFRVRRFLPSTTPSHAGRTTPSRCSPRTGCSRLWRRSKENSTAR